MTDPLLEEVYRAREKLWQRAGGTMRGLGEYLMECDRRAKARGLKWLDSEEEKEAIGAEVRARLAAEAAGEAMCVGEPQGEYRAVGEETHTESQRDGGTEGEGKSSRGDAGTRRGIGKAHTEAQRDGGTEGEGKRARAEGRRRGGEMILESVTPKSEGGRHE